MQIINFSLVPDLLAQEKNCLLLRAGPIGPAQIMSLYLYLVTVTAIFLESPFLVYTNTLHFPGLTAVILPSLPTFAILEFVDL